MGNLNFTPAQLQAKIEALVDKINGAEGGANVVDALPDAPKTNTLYYLTQGVAVETPIAGVDYQAALKATPDAPAPAPQAYSGSTLDGAAAAFSCTDAATFFALFNAALDAGQDSMTAAVFVGETVLFYLFHAIEGLGQQFAGGLWYRLTATGPQPLGDATQALRGTWRFSQADADSGIAAALLDLAGSPGFFYHDGAAWKPARESGEASGLPARVGALEDLGAAASAGLGAGE